MHKLLHMGSLFIGTCACEGRWAFFFFFSPAPQVEIYPADKLQFQHVEGNFEVMLPDSGAISGEIGQARREGRAGASQAGRRVRLPFGLSAALAPQPERVKRGRRKQREGLDVQRPAEEEDAAEAALPEEAAPVPPGKGADKSKDQGNHREEPDLLNVLLGLEELEEGPEAPAAHLGVI